MPLNFDNVALHSLEEILSETKEKSKKKKRFVCRNVGETLGINQEWRTFASSNTILYNDILTGLELELVDCCGIEDFAPDLSLWEMKRDASLRGNCPVELTFRSPLCGFDIERALSQFNKIVREDNDINPEINEYTGCHVHLGMAETTNITLLRFIILYIYFERILYKYGGSNRQNNINCIPYYETNTGLDFIVDLLNTGKSLTVNYVNNLMPLNACRYSGLNLCSLSKFGSVEIRLHEGINTIERATEWINILHTMYNYARTSITEEVGQFIQHMTDLPCHNAIKTVFPLYKDKLEYRDHALDIMKGAKQLEVIKGKLIS